MKKQVNLSFSLAEAKIIFDALSSHRYKISKKKQSILEDKFLQDEAQEFVNQRILAIESEIEKTNDIFQKLGHLLKDDE